MGICPDEFCSKSCLTLKFDASAAGTRAAEKRRLLRRGFLAPNARQVGDTLPSAAASPSPAASPEASPAASPDASPAASPLPSPGPPVSLTRHETFAEATARETADDIEEARRRGEKREACVLGWNETWNNQTAAQEGAANASSTAQSAFSAQVANASLMDRYMSEEGLLRSNAAP